jgi:Mor family transcriptional regulator
MECVSDIAKGSLLTLLTHNLSTADGQRAAHAALVKKITRIMIFHWGGRRTPYIPTEHSLNRLERDHALYTEYNGSNCAELCQRYAIHRSTLYRSVNRHAEWLTTQTGSIL